MASRIEFEKYYVTFINGVAKVTWTETHPETGKQWRPRFSLPVAKGATAAETRAALIAWVAEREAQQFRAGGATIAELLDDYAKDRERDGKVIENIHSDIVQLKTFFGAMKPQDVTPDICRLYTAQEAKKGRSGSTVLTRLARLRAALNWAVARKRMAADAMPAMWFPQASAPRELSLTDSQVAALLDELDRDESRHVRMFVLLCLLTGGRTSAVLELTWDRVDFGAGIVNLKVPRSNDITKKKNKKGRAIVYMTETLRTELLAAKLMATDEVKGPVVEYKGAAVKSVKIALRKAMSRAKLPEGASAHTLRHTAATWAEEGRAGNIDKMLGHKNAATTEHYKHGAARLTEEPLKAVEERMPKVARLKVVK